MITVQIPRNSIILQKVSNFYKDLYLQRIKSNARNKYPLSVVFKNIKQTLFITQVRFNDNALKRPTIIVWKNNNWYEIKYKNWHFAVIVQLDMFGNNVAIIQDCMHDKDYHNDTMQTEPFKMDDSNDQADLVDWKLNYLNNLISESIRESIKRLL
jgi:hypothetical protein